MKMETRSHCPFHFEKRSAEPSGLKMGMALHLIVKDGVADARENLALNDLPTTQENTDPRKGWRDALTGIAIDAIYREARPAIMTAHEAYQPQADSLFRIGRDVISITRGVLRDIQNRMLEVPPSPDGTAWLAEVLQELQLELIIAKKANIYTHTTNASEALFELFGFMVNALPRETSPDISAEMVDTILANSLESVVDPITKIHLEDSYLLPDEIYESFEGILPVGLRPDGIGVEGERFVILEDARERFRQKQEQSTITSVIDGCPAIISPRVTQRRYPDTPTPQYRNVIHGLYHQMTDCVVQNYA